ncbi:hypothetical protein SD53_06175 [Rheinheimera mesophila]|nr:hypothetical protein SD53_06175 [Rheinheimera mesophila]
MIRLQQKLSRSELKQKTLSAGKSKPAFGEDKLQSKVNSEKKPSKHGIFLVTTSLNRNLMFPFSLEVNFAGSVAGFLFYS